MPVDSNKETIRKAKCDWVLSLDADEILQENSEILKTILTYFKGMGTYDTTVFNLKILRGEDIFRTGKIIRNLPTFKYKGRVHETFFSTLGDTLYANIDVVVVGDKRESLQKQVYYNNLLQQTMADEPTNPRWPYLFIRDNLSSLNYQEMLNIGERYLKIECNSPLTRANFQSNYYNFRIVLMLMYKCLQEERYSLFDSYKKVVESISVGNADYLFLNFFNKLDKVQKQIMTISQTFFKQYNQLEDMDIIFPMEYLNSLLGTYLLLTNNIDESQQVFKQLKETSNRKVPYFISERLINRLIELEE